MQQLIWESPSDLRLQPSARKQLAADAGLQLQHTRCRFVRAAGGRALIDIMHGPKMRLRVFMRFRL